MASTSSEPSPSPQPNPAAEEIQDQDRLARQIFYATSFENDAVSANALLKFAGNSNADGSFDESLFLLRLTNHDVVSLAGCDAAELQNQRVREKRIKNGKEPVDPVPGVDRRYYCGYTSADAVKLRISGENYNVELQHAPEYGMISHVSIFLRPSAGRKIHPADRTEAGRRLALAFGDPVPHVCDIDTSDAEHPVVKHGAAILTMTAA